MTQVGELVAIPNLVDLANDTKCPFCHEKELSECAKIPEQVSTLVESKPDQLNCDVKKRTDGDLPYTTAKHHLISAMQCYAQVRRLVRMGSMVGYDINNPPNGIGLPTTHHTLLYPLGNSRVKYGSLDGDKKGVNVEKRKVAFAVMAELGAQWHVGHHHFPINGDYEQWLAEGADEESVKDRGHETFYDSEVVNLLLSLEKRISRKLCEDEELDSKFTKEMDKISKEIRDKLEKFNGHGGSKPVDSHPFFVSRRSSEFAKRDGDVPLGDLPIVKTQRGKKRKLKEI